jgi:hypothetical protein
VTELSRLTKPDADPPPVFEQALAEYAATTASVPVR